MKDEMFMNKQKRDPNENTDIKGIINRKRDSKLVRKRKEMRTEGEQMVLRREWKEKNWRVVENKKK